MPSRRRTTVGRATRRGHARLGTILLPILLVAIAAACSPTTQSDRSPNPVLAIPSSVDGGLSVLSVSDVIGAHARGAWTADTPLAVGGWLEMPLVPSCPFDPSNPNPALLERHCGWMDAVLSQDQQQLAVFGAEGTTQWARGVEPQGPYLAPRQNWGAVINGAIAEHPPASGNTYEPRPAVIVGHFHDPRAADCPADQEAACDAEFVADQVAWLDGETLPTAPSA